MTRLAIIASTLALLAACTGSTGATGLDGRPGAEGEQGDDGARGERGERGETGSAGPRGAEGDAGPRGEPGPAGDAGPQGEPGVDGIDGEDGTDGAACWDLDSDGEADDGEDTNLDGTVDVLDCSTEPSAASVETCEVCHGPERSADVAVMHGLMTPDFLISDPAELIVTIGDATVGVNGEVDVFFRIVDGDGDPWVGLGPSDVRMTLAQLVPGANGDASRWQSYINQTETPTAGVGTGDGSSETQATAQRASGSTLMDLGTGDYVFRFGANGGGDMDLRDVVGSGVSPVPVAYDENLTHRVAMQFGGSLPVSNNPSFDFVPSSGAMTSRAIVATETCNSCHQELAFHGGARKDVEYCVTCHNPGSTDANSDNTVDFTVMVHKIHSGRNLPSVLAGEHYKIWGHGDSEHDFSEIGFPQPLLNCQKCHDTGNAETPEAGNYATVPTREACGSCHDNVDFALGTGHVGGAQADNSQCVNCHDATGNEGAHTTIESALSGRFQYVIDETDFNANTGELAITFSVIDPSNAGQAYDVLDDPEFTAGGGVSRLAVLVGWDTRDYHNTGSGNPVGQPIALNPLSGGDTPATDNGDGTFTITATLPEDAVGTGVVAIEGHPAGDSGGGTYDVRVPVRSALAYFAITDTNPVERRAPIDIVAKCDNCHGTLSMHGANRTDEGQVCVICHNPNATDIARRPDDHTDLAAPTADGKKEESIDLKLLIHGIHGAAKREHPLVVYGFGNSEHEFGPEHVTFPGVLNNCETCHNPGAYELPLASGVLGTTIDSAPSAATKADATAAALADPSDDFNISPTAAVCSACHDSTVAKGHMEQNGASFRVRQSRIQ